jgi:ATP-binding cassette subfamily B (MDR/TAP) protein 1
VNAQQLSMDETFMETPDIIHAARLETIERVMTAADEEKIAPELIYKPKGLIRSFGLLLYEQRKHWLWYAILLIGCAGGGCKELLHLTDSSC